MARAPEPGDCCRPGGSCDECNPPPVYCGGCEVELTDDEGVRLGRSYYCPSCAIVEVAHVVSSLLDPTHVVPAAQLGETARALHELGSLLDDAGLALSKRQAEVENARKAA